MRWERLRVTVAAMAVALAGAAWQAPLAAQLANAGTQPGASLTVRVRDATGGWVPMASVSVEHDGLRQTRITTDSGRATFAVPAGTRVSLSVRRIGYVPATTTTTVTQPTTTFELTLGRSIPWSLDTVRVLAQRSVGGIVVSARTQEPVSGASVRVLGTQARTTSGTDGSFTLPLDGRETVTLIVKAPGFAPYLRAERLERTASGDYLVLLQDDGMMHNAERTALWEAERRISWAESRDAILGGRELRATGGATVDDALRVSQTVTTRGVRAGGNACVFINGLPAVGRTLASVPLEGVRLVEVYSSVNEMTLQLAREWPATAPCGSETLPPARGLGAARWVVVWTQ
ncbi:MAG: carboxypeptidase regulatory-like domain-containing protein [Gemmatimonadaceae bacterium]|jgi:hypothetical protein|nr:carboxypeptidase regulatory-like domain-containing protein [Gemmatimonadaceae bacterium]